MAKFEYRGIKKYIDMLKGLDGDARELCKKVTYAGAKVVADEIKKNLKNLDAVPDVEAINAWREKRPVKISVTQKIDLILTMGIARITDKYGVIGTKIGWNDYNSIETNRWPIGQPNRLIANVCESGSTAMLKQPFVRPAVERTKKEALAEMAKTADAEIRKITGGNG